MGDKHNEIVISITNKKENMKTNIRQRLCAYS